VAPRFGRVVPALRVPERLPTPARAHVAAGVPAGGARRRRAPLALAEPLLRSAVRASGEPEPDRVRAVHAVFHGVRRPARDTDLGQPALVLRRSLVRMDGDRQTLLSDL